MENILLITPRKTDRLSLAEFYGAAFRRLGYNTIIEGIETQEDLAARLHDKLRGFGARILRDGLPPDRPARHLIEVAKEIRPVLTIVTRGDRLKAETVSELRRLSSLGCVNIYTDAPFAIPGNGAVRLVETMAEYTAVFSFSNSLIPVFYQLGARVVRWLPFAYSADVHLVDANQWQDKNQPLVYVGSWGPLIEHWLEPLVPYGLRIFGPSWQHVPRQSPLRGCWMPGQGMWLGMRDVIAKAQITVNFVRAEHGCAHSMKTFEIPACGGFMLTNRTSEQEYFFRDGEHCIFFDRPEELIETVTHYLKDSASREGIERRAREHVLPHSYDARARTLVEFFRSGNWCF